MKEFEEECKNHNIPLYVLPPKRPQYNGGVERGNKIFKEEFYYNRKIHGSSLGEIRNELKDAYINIIHIGPILACKISLLMSILKNIIWGLKKSHL